MQVSILSIGFRKILTLLVLLILIILFLILLPLNVYSDTTAVSDTFTRSVSSGWGSADTGGSYTLTGSSTDFNVTGSEATMNGPTSSVSRLAVLASVSQINQDITFKVKTSKVAEGISQEIFFINRYINSTNMYRSKIRLTPTNGVTVQGGKVVSGTETLLGTQSTVTGLAYAADSYINIRATITGTSPTTIQIKAWADGDAEPGSWDYTTTDSEATLQVEGGAGLRINLPSATSNAPVLFTFDNFTITTSDTPLAQSGLTFLTDTFTRSVTDGWGSPDTGGDYVIISGSGSDFDVSGSEGTINSPTAAVSRAIILNSSSQQDVDIKFKAKVNKLPEGTAAELFWLARRVDPSNHYRGKIRLTSSSSITIQATKVVEGTESTLGTQVSTGVSLEADAYVYIRSQITGTNPTTINMKVWDADSSEPVGWQYTTTDSESVLQSSGAVGFRTNLPSSITNAPILYTLDSINVTTDDDEINTPTAPAQEGTTIITDTFTRSVSSGWGSADTGGAYTLTSGNSSNFAVSGTEGTMLSSDSGSSRAVILTDTSQQDVDILFKTKISTVPTGSAAEVFWIARRVNNSNQYRGKLRFTSSNSVTLQASSVVNGTETLLGSQTSAGVTYSANSYVWVRSQVIGTNPTNIYMKAWSEGSTEPVDWQYIVSDYSETIIQPAGSIGFRTNIPSSFANPPVTVTFDSINVTTTDIDLYDPNSVPTPTPAPAGPSSVTATINLSGSATVSKLKVGVTHTQESIDSGGDATAMTNAKELLRNGLDYQNQHIHGFGANNLWDDPSKDVSEWNWSSLDTRVKLMRDTDATPIITLCCAPTWMVDSTWSPGKYNGSNTDWGQLEKAPLDIYETDFAYMVGKIAERYNGVNLDSDGVAYPKIIYFQVWNEMKGLWDRSNNRWNYAKYNRLYGLVYDSLKSIRTDAVIGGPYVRASKYLYPNGSQTSSITNESYGTIDRRDLQVISEWLTWLTNNLDSDGNYKAQFITLDSGTNTKDVVDGTFPTNIWSATQLFSDLNGWMNTEMTSILGSTLPIWWAEDYVGKVNGDPLLITPEAQQPSALAMLLYRHVTSGTSVSLRWGGEEQVSDSGIPQDNKQNLFSSTQFAGGGQPYENYNVYKYYNDYFKNGTSVYPVTIEPATNDITVISSSTKTLLINRRNSSITVNLYSDPNNDQYVLGAYEVKLVDIPTTDSSSSSSSSLSPTPTPTGASSKKTTPFFSYYAGDLENQDVSEEGNNFIETGKKILDPIQRQVNSILTVLEKITQLTRPEIIGIAVAVIFISGALIFRFKNLLFKKSPKV